MARRSGRWDGRCSFCGKRHDQVRRVIGGPQGILICNECVALCNSILEEEQRGAGPQLGMAGPWWRRGVLPRGVDLTLGKGRMSDDLRALKPIRAPRLDVITEGQLALHVPVPFSVPDKS